MRGVLLFFAALLAGITLYAQTTIADEEFTLSFSANDQGGTVLFQGKSHSFSVDIVAKEVKKTDNPGFYLVDNHIVQTSIVPLPPVKFNLSQLTEAQQKQALSAYVDYEMAYFKNEAKLKVTNLKKEWVTINSRLFIVWHFIMPPNNDVKQQIYLSTICFNQILDLNTALLAGDDYSQREDSLKKMAGTVQMAEKGTGK
jgi:hypothetical protein